MIHLLVPKYAYSNNLSEHFSDVDIHMNTLMIPAVVVVLVHVLEYVLMTFHVLDESFDAFYVHLFASLNLETSEC